VPEPSVIAPTGDGALGEATDGLIVDLSDIAFIDSRELAVIVEVDEQLTPDRRDQLSGATFTRCDQSNEMSLLRPSLRPAPLGAPSSQP
jgi:hypothetical protein